MTQEGSRRSRIVVGVDGSTQSIQALRWALGQAKATGAVVEAVNAWQIPSGFGMPPTLLPDEDLAAAAEQALTTAVDRTSADMPQVTVERRVIHGHPAAVLLEQANDADLLVVGSHGHGGFIGALVGSVSQYCTQHATCPVVVVRTST